jgi:hypothetical protein
MAQDNSLSKVTGYRLDNWDLIPRRGRIFLFVTIFRLALGPIQSAIQQVPEAVSLEVKWSADAPPYSAEAWRLKVLMVLWSYELV